jgi:NAD(P)-dependent dehydrogenase (short-subunit alcohol dehydrogenase family)
MTTDPGDRPVALVTGASRGLGLEVARQLAREGHRVVLTARDAAKADEAVAALRGEGLDVEARVLDVTSDESAAALAAGLDRLDVLVNNAAGYVDWSETASNADLAASHALFETNLWGTWRVAQALLPLLRASPHGRLVNVSSGAGSHGDPGFGLTTNGGATASYGISKAAVNALTAKLAAEVEGSSLLVNAVCPGLTATAPGMAAMGARPVPEGARSIVWAALLPDDGPRGGFFRDGRPLPW